MSQSKPKNKKLYYRRAKWSGQSDSTLEQLLKLTHNFLPRVGDRIFKTAMGELKGVDIKADDKGLFLHIASYVPGQPTSTIHKDRSALSALIAAEQAPEGTDFMEGDIFIFIKDNHVILCPSGTRESVATRYFYKVFEKTDQDFIAQSLELDKVANASKLKMIQKEGVKELSLSSSLYQASLHRLQEHQSKPSGLVSSIVSQLENIFSQDVSLNNISELENLNIKLTLKFDGKEGRKKHQSPEFGDAGRARLFRTAEMLLNDDSEEGFVIITGQGNTITSEEIRISDTIKIKSFGKSLKCDDAWEKIYQYYDKLKRMGVLTQ